MKIFNMVKNWVAAVLVVANSFLTGKMCKYTEFQLMEKPINFFQIKCAVSDSGFPHSNSVRWLHNGHEMKGKTSFLLSFNHAQAKFSKNLCEI